MTPLTSDVETVRLSRQGIMSSAGDEYDERDETWDDFDEGGGEEEPQVSRSGGTQCKEGLTPAPAHRRLAACSRNLMCQALTLP